ncbi:hypothetical protein [Streptomyces asiaticus]|uniref:hypothetical protein n=1 Tax=Streptomyces asiaticus TaxID=114695 RepID=UPI001BAAE593|nr:hypothetical protein [Streptomyces asiaticus]
MRTRIGRWQIELHQRAIYIQRQPKPNCTHCKGTGELQYGPGIGPDGEDPDIAPCRCWNPYRSLRIPLGPRPVERYPF